MKALIALSLLFFAPLVFAADWRPAKARLMTRWAKDVSPTSTLSDYPRPQLVRKDWLNLNGLWQFQPATDLSTPPAEQSFSHQILVPFCMESALSGVMEHHDFSWYRRTFQIPKDWSGRDVLVHFGAVDYQCAVWINGKQIGRHTGGYDAFSFDITSALKTGDNELLVGVTDTTDPSQPRGKQIDNPHGIFYVPCSGIWQTVWLEPVPETRIENLKVTPDLDGSKVLVCAEIGGMVDKTPRTEVIVRDAGNEIAHAEGVGEVAVPIKQPKIWSPDDPHLYEVTISIRLGDRILDTVNSYFGMRKIEIRDVNGVRRILLNGKPITMVGPLDQGYWPDGNYTAPTDNALKFDLDQIKRLGFNMLRKHVKVEPQRFYYWCDKLGILVWQDMPSMFADGAKSPKAREQFEKELKQLVDQHINSPSIVMWVPFNEGWGEYDAERIAKEVKEWDPTRLVDNASGWTDAGAGDVHDIHSYPGPAAPKQEKDRAIVLGEFGGLGLGVDGHTWADRAWGYQGMASQDELTERYVRLLGRFWDLHDNDGLCACVFTQLTDVETECNGLFTYDREVLKVDADQVREANLGHGKRYIVTPVVPTAQVEPALWQYTFDKPGHDWEAVEFDASNWKTGKSGFGAAGTPGAIVNTNWNTPDIWLRREIMLPDKKLDDLRLVVHHDEDCEIYLNGVLANKARRFTTEYGERAISTDAMKTLKPGNNLIAVHCHQTIGGQYIDVGLAKVIEKNPQATLEAP